MALPNPTDFIDSIKGNIASTNANVGILDNLFGSKSTESFYEAFYSSFLTTANSLPINSLWVVYIESVPSVRTDTILKAFEGWDVNKTLEIAKQEADSSYRKKGIVIAQGVKNIGDSMGVDRVGYKNTGYIQGLVGTGRVGFPLLNISFMENNVSFTDYVLRPWMIAVSHASLKEFSLKTNIHVWFLSKTGARNDLARRKIVTYYDCCPVSIDEEEYNYSGSDSLKQRQVQFAYSRYEMTDADSALLNLINVGGFTSGLLGDLGNKLKKELQRQFGANNPTQYINNLVDRAKEFGSDLVTGSATQIVTNVAGKVQGRVENAISSVEKDIRSGTNRLVGNITDSLDSAVGNASTSRSNGSSLPSGGVNKSIAAQVDTQRRIGANNASFGGYKEKKIKADDSPLYVKSIETEQRGKPAEVDVNKPINQNDVPNTNGSIPTRQITKTATNPNDDTVTLNTKLKYDYKRSDPPMNDVRNGSINHEDVVKKIGQNDYVSALQVNNAGKSINQNDTPNRNSIAYTVRTINADDAPMHKKSLDI